MIGSWGAFSYHLPFTAREIKLFPRFNPIALVYSVGKKKKKIGTICTYHQ
jgi:hypothetical protein